MRKVFRFFLWTLVALGALLGLARATAIRWWRIPETDAFLAASVAPTLRGGDLVLLWRLTPASFGDLVLCPEPGAPERFVIGRLIGESGDRVTVKADQLSVNQSQATTETHCSEFAVDDPNTGEEVRQGCTVEVLNNHRHARGDVGGKKVVPAPTTTEVGPGEIFLLSDNRLYPYDSRDFGPVPRASCREIVFFRVLGKGGFADAESRFTYIR